MVEKNCNKKSIIEPTSYLWHRLFMENGLDVNGTVIEVAPGYEPKIGNALALLGFKGILFVIEPDPAAAWNITNSYRRILPQANIRQITRCVEDTRIVEDVPCDVDALVASHPFDDMVIANIFGKTGLFSQERKSGTTLSPALKRLYDTVDDKEYTKSIQSVTNSWKSFIKETKPHYFIASQYPSHTLTVKKLVKRQNSGFAVLKRLKKFYKNSLEERRLEDEFGFKGNPKWWIVAKNPYLIARTKIKNIAAIDEG